MDIKSLIAQKKNKKDPMLSAMETLLGRFLEKDIQTAIDTAQQSLVDILEGKEKECVDMFAKMKQNLKEQTESQTNKTTDEFIAEANSIISQTESEVKKILAVLPTLKGEKGDTGKSGKDGINGVDGNKIFVVKYKQNFPKNVVKGDIVIIEDTGDLFIYE